jgi:TRAP transporter 4TM/12TM fusion protein
VIKVNSKTETAEGVQLSQEELADLVIETESGARRPANKVISAFIIGLALSWALFQLWIASPLQFMAAEHIGLSVLNDTQTRSIHLTFALLLVFLAYPASKRPRKIENIKADLFIAGLGAVFFAHQYYVHTSGLFTQGGVHTILSYIAFAGLIACFMVYPILRGAPRTYIPAVDWILGFVAAYCSFYTFIFYEDLAGRSGLPTNLDTTVGVVGILLLLEAARRALGMPLVVIASLFLIYTLAGNLEFIPDVIRHKGQSIVKTTSHQWLTTEGVFGIAIGVSTSFVFMFVLFGALLDRAGAGNYFIKLAFSILGHLRGGPAKAAVVSSAMMGLISGSSIASTVTIGTFTIPLMKRVGFSGTKAGAVEVASAVNAQIMPPVMGAAAFIISERVNIPYFEVVKHAFLPAVISYIALFYIVHLEAVKTNVKALPKPITRTLKQSMLVWSLVICTLIIMSGLIYVIFGNQTCIGESVCINGLKYYTGEYNVEVVGAILLLIYFILLKYTTTVPELTIDDPSSPVVELAETAPTFKTGLHYLLPIFVLIWCLMVERMSAGLSAFWATSLMMFILLTQHFLRAVILKTGNLATHLKDGALELFDGLIMGSRNMVGVAIATASAGIIVGAVSLTGVGQVLTEVVEIIAGDNIFLILVLTAFISLILGMGLPTTANYIVVSSLMAQVVVELGAQNGLVVPLIAVHLFVFYFGIMADITPPVGLASFAAAAISGADPIKTGAQGFVYASRTAILPFFFIFDTEILLIGIDTWWYAIWVVIKATLALMLFSAAMQNYFIVKSRIYETVLLYLITFTLFAPQYWVNKVVPPYIEGDVKQIEKSINDVIESDSIPDSVKQIKIRIRGEDKDSEIKTVNTYLSLKGAKSAKQALESYGVVPYSVSQDGNTVYEVLFDSQAFKSGIEFDLEIIGIEVPQDQPNKNWAIIPAILLLIFVVFSQRLRRKRQEALEQVS